MRRGSGASAREPDSGIVTSGREKICLVRLVKVNNLFHQPWLDLGFEGPKSSPEDLPQGLVRVYSRGRVV
jgi:hypothetical protein